MLQKDQYENDGGKNFNEDCWEACGEKSGNCEWCGDYRPEGTHMACCKANYGDWTAECKGRGHANSHRCFWPASAGDTRGDYEIGGFAV